jgi:hypothetical protein
VIHVPCLVLRCVEIAEMPSKRHHTGALYSVIRANVALLDAVNADDLNRAFLSIRKPTDTTFLRNGLLQNDAGSIVQPLSRGLVFLYLRTVTKPLLVK